LATRPLWESESGGRGWLCYFLMKKEKGKKKEKRMDGGDAHVL